MNLKFVVNDYMLVWNLLFRASISEPIHKMKQKLWITYKKQYNMIVQDNAAILKDQKNFIPDDDTIYNLFFENSHFEEIKKQTEKYRLSLLKIWDEKKKQVNQLLKEIVRFDIKSYSILVVCPTLEVVDYIPTKEKKIHSLVWGKQKDLRDEAAIITNLIYYIVKNEMAFYKEEYKEIVQAIIELAIQNEFYTRLSGVSHYLSGDPTLKFLKRQIYPYWLMYLGAGKEEMLTYMMRDQIAFDVEKYTVETELAKVDLYGFIDFCIKNQKYIVKINELEIL